ncbi:MAG TPA: hypothetical protein VN622_05965 [Clostridia bacterium]|nr:hypothetical protein [Clostridia bacterium]
MARRKKYTAVEKTGQVRAAHVAGQGDVVYRGFQCLNSKCEEYIFKKEDELLNGFEFACPKCGFEFQSGESVKFYDYKLVKLPKKEVLKKGSFEVLHDDYVEESQRYKYCIICNTMKPLLSFGAHESRKSKHQGECASCKTQYNTIKNSTRTPDQHREAAQNRRLLVEMAGIGKLDSKAISERFKQKCFKCGVTLEKVSDANIDHTLPVYYLWPATTGSATLLCKKHNGQKLRKWPSKFYGKEELKRLAVLTGIKLEILEGKPFYNPDAIERLKTPDAVDKLLTKYAKYKTELQKLRNRLKLEAGVDIFAVASQLSPDWVTEADKMTSAAKGKAAKGGTD